MGTKSQRLEVIEVEKIDGRYPTVLGKGRNGSNLVYFQLDGLYLRQPDGLHKGGTITVTDEEVIGVGENVF